MNYKVSAIYKETVQELVPIQGEREAEIISNMLFEDLLSIPKTTRITQPNFELTTDQFSTLNEAIKRLQNHEPIQHILGQAHFYGHIFKVNEHTLIPRPETEELVNLIIQENQKPKLKILDIGTGSGCIAISLAKSAIAGDIMAIDISEEALALASENALLNKATVHFQQTDILNNEIPWDNLDIIVSNPPYIPASERGNMSQNVADYEPGLALFVPDHDPLIFYRVIAEKAMISLKKGGKLYFEIHEAFGKETAVLLEKVGFSEVKIFQDMQGKPRIARGIKGI